MGTAAQQQQQQQHGGKVLQGAKSAKRKAAEALLAAKFGSGSAAAATAAALPAAAAAAATQLQHKRHRSSLNSIIHKFEGNSGTAAAVAGAAAGAAAGTQAAAGASHAWDAAAAAAAAAGSNAAVQQKPQLAKLQQVLQQLQGRHQKMKHHQQQQQQQQQQQHRGEPQQTQQQPAQQQQQQQQQQDQEQGLCEADVAAAAAASARSSPAAVEQAQQHVQVQLPHVDWGAVLDVDLSSMPRFRVASGYERFSLPGGLKVWVGRHSTTCVSFQFYATTPRAAHISPAAGDAPPSQVLVVEDPATMQDPVVAIDLEWRPEFGRRFTPVAMVQLASSRVAVLVRACRMGYKLPPALREFLRDPSVSLLGFGWAGSDEGKMRSTFGTGCQDFGRFLDLQKVAQGLGYCGFGLARLTTHVLGLTLPKSKRISMSNWEVNASPWARCVCGAVKYAALDVLVAGQVFRALRLWHSSPSLCEVCHYDLASVASSSCGAGGGSSASGYVCSCGKELTDIRGYLQHCERSSHKARWAECSGCGCARRLPWPSGMAKRRSGCRSSGSGGSSSSSGSVGGSTEELSEC
ncbi:hypothetical protein COO60DRAFT_1639575 [Scenedesmus sp. NREL 46B-D3]|nr:hypothetical protein COO60DRAFT_1639575 [Scenedesmus sp. NREL 46B-D3]